MKTKFEKDLLQSLSEAVAHAEGRKTGARTHIIHVPDVRAIRRRLRMSQKEFTRSYRIPLATLKNWEQDRRRPDATAAAFLLAIARLPREIRKALTSIKD